MKTPAENIREVLDRQPPGAREAVLAGIMTGVMVERQYWLEALEKTLRTVEDLDDRGTITGILISLIEAGRMRRYVPEEAVE